MLPIRLAREVWAGLSLCVVICSSYGIVSSYERVEYSASGLDSDAISIGRPVVVKEQKVRNKHVALCSMIFKFTSETFCRIQY